MLQTGKTVIWSPEKLLQISVMINANFYARFSHQWWITYT